MCRREVRQSAQHRDGIRTLAEHARERRDVERVRVLAARRDDRRGGLRGELVEIDRSHAARAERHGDAVGVDVAAREPRVASSHRRRRHGESRRATHVLHHLSWLDVLARVEPSVVHFRGDARIESFAVEGGDRPAAGASGTQRLGVLRTADADRRHDTDAGDRHALTHRSVPGTGQARRPRCVPRTGERRAVSHARVPAC